MKIVMLEGTERDSKIKREVEVLQMLVNPCIIRIRDSFEHQKKLYIIMDYAAGNGGTLRNLMDKRIEEKKSFPQEEILGIMEQIVFAVKFCHNKQIVHRDIKPENIFLDVDLNVKLGDFGLASILQNDNFTNTSSATLHYAAPEIFEGLDTRFEPDIWALGVILYEMITLTKPFQGPNPMAIMNRILGCKFNEKLLREKCHDKIADFILGMLIVDPNERPNIIDVSLLLTSLQGEKLDLPNKEFAYEEEKGELVNPEATTLVPSKIPKPDIEEALEESKIVPELSFIMKDETRIFTEKKSTDCNFGIKLKGLNIILFLDKELKIIKKYHNKQIILYYSEFLQITESTICNCGTTRIEFIDTINMKYLNFIPTKGQPRALCLLPENKIAVGMLDGMVYIVKDMKNVVNSYKTKCRINCLLWVKESNCLLIGGYEGLRVWNSQTKTITKSISADILGYIYSFGQLEERIFATGSEQIIYELSNKGSILHSNMKEDYGIFAMKICSNGRAVLGLDEGFVSGWDLHSRTKLFIFQPAQGFIRFYSLQQVADDIFITGDNYNIIQIIDVCKQKVLHSYNAKKMIKGICRIDIY